MELNFKERSFYSSELRILKALKLKNEKRNTCSIKFYHYLIAGLLGIIFTYIASILPDSFLLLLFGTMAVFAFSFIVFTPYEVYKSKKRHQNKLRKLDSVINKGIVQTSIINSEKIAIAPEFEDEGNMYIIKLNQKEVLYFWDTQYYFNEKFPLKFEVYEEEFFNLIGRQIYPLSEKISPIKIDRKAKWKFMSKYGVFGDLKIEKVNFENLLEKYKNCI